MADQSQSQTSIDLGDFPQEIMQQQTQESMKTIEDKQRCKQGKNIFFNSNFKLDKSDRMPIKGRNELQDHDKNLKTKLRRNRELGELEENQILEARLRSNSGKVYSSSVSVEAGSIRSEPNSPRLDMVEEEIEKETEMCGEEEEECCRGTSRLVKMIAKLQQSVDGVLKKVSTQEIVQSNAAHRIEDLQEDCKKNAHEIDDLGSELQETKFQLQLVSNIVIKQDQQIEFLKEKINDLQQREMSANVIISGIPEKKHEKPIESYNRFVEKELEIQELIPANKAFRIGSGKNRPLLVELQHGENKRKLFSKATKLRGKVNKNGKPYLISDHLPEERNEEKRRANELVSENKKKEKSHQLDMSFVRGKLHINEELYCKKVKPPTASDLLNPDEQLFNKAEELDIVKGATLTEEKSKFTSFAIAIQDTEDVQAAMVKIRMKYADATHVTCAYRLPGANTPLNQDYVDDGEFGCGRVLLKVLKDEQYMNMMVVIVRYYSGKHLGALRFEIFRKLAHKAIKALMSKRSEQDAQTAVEQLPDHFRNAIPTNFAADREQDWNEIENWSNEKKDE